MMGTVKWEIAYEYLCMKLEHVQRKNLRCCIKSWRVYPCVSIISLKVDF